MKRLHRVLLALLVIALAASLCACAKKEVGKELLGQWNLAGGVCNSLGLDYENFRAAEMTVTLTFEEDGAVSIVTAKQGLAQTSQAGEWSIEEETLSLTLAGQQTQWSWSVEEDELHLDSGDGSSLQFIKDAAA